MAANVHDVIMLFGDSITQAGWAEDGFAARLAQVYARKLDVLNRGLSGYNTEWAIPVLEQMLATQQAQQHLPKVRLLVIWFGANDAVIKPFSQHVPLPKFIENMKYMVQLLHSPDSSHYSPTTKIILITPPPVNTYQRSADLASRNPPLEMDRLFETTKQYAEGVRDAAVASNVAVADVWTAMWNGAGENEQALSRYLSDGLHLTHEGYTASCSGPESVVRADRDKIAYETLIETIAAEYPELHYGNLRSVFPAWNEVDWANPGPSVQKRET
ncbi:GDSL Lipase/Acylhydrolase [Mycena sanguinolenta]|uniref:GDSL Lipase/Acylhydrolase n=1 Tax=Mycena sanguinolenta TaxID=230812 RepID=A0A8H6YQG8_9AGAR|nr:GDSL Lipase/Acylhydrolase [Mycena sanguinolenta]